MQLVRFFKKGRDADHKNYKCIFSSSTDFFNIGLCKGKLFNKINYYFLQKYDIKRLYKEPKPIMQHL